MELDAFKELLKKANLNKKSFSEIIKIPYSTVNNWGSINKAPVPDWVEKFLNLYIKNEKCEDLKNMIKNSGVLK